MKTMLLFAIGGLIISMNVCCKKTIDKQKEDYVLGVLTEGEWFLENYTENEIDYSYEFTDYSFQFYKNGNLDAITSTAIFSGTWKGDVNNLAMTVNFPSANTRLTRLNYVWRWLKSNVGLVFAESVIPEKKISIRLRKK